MAEGIRYDVVVAGAGGAGLHSALAARQAGARTLVLEKAPESLRGGNTYFAGGGLKFSYKDLSEIRELLPDLSEDEARSIEIEPYTPDDYYAEFMRITDGQADPGIIEVLTRESNRTIRWMRESGIEFQLYTSQGVRIGNKLRWPHGAPVVGVKGGGAGLIDSLFGILHKVGTHVCYDTKLVKLIYDSKGEVTGLTIRDDEGYRDIECGAVVLACGGFQANVEMRTRYLGPGWDVVKLRGTRFNTGDGITAALDMGAQSAGQWGGCHAAAIDINAPDIADRSMGDKTQRRSYNFGVVVNMDGKRFFDEGQDLGINTYARLGATIAAQPKRAAFQIFDSKVEHLLEERYSTGQRVTADSLEHLADALGIDREAFIKTLEEFNRSVVDSAFDPSTLDGKHTAGVFPPKSNWAQKIDVPPFFAYGVTCGITFTYGGLKMDPQAQVLDREDRVIPGLYVAGEIVGGIYYGGYPPGSGLVDGATIGRIAGSNAARYALKVEKSRRR